MSRFTRGETINITLVEGARYTIGRSAQCNLSMPENDKLADDAQFMLTLSKGNVYIVELARKKPTKMRCLPGERYRLTKGTMLDLGNSEICLIEQATTRYEDEEQEVNVFDDKPKLKFRCLAGLYKSVKHQIKVKRDEDERDFIIGRQPSHEICLPNIGTISRAHAKISYSDELFWEIEDLGSTTGTFVCVGRGKCYISKNPTDVDISKELEDGEIISIPNVEFKFKYI